MNQKAVTVLKRVGIVIVVIVVIHTALNLLAAAKLRRAYAALEKEGRPMKLDQIIPKWVPDTNNAALLFNSVIFQLKAEAAGKEDLLGYFGTVWPDVKAGRLAPEKTDELHGRLQSDCVVSAVRLLERGIEKTACRFDLDYTKGPGILLPHLAGMRGLSRLLAVRAVTQAADGGSAKAWETVIVGLRFAETLRAEPILISQLVRAAQTDLALDAAQSIARKGLPAEAQAAALDALLARVDDDTPFTLALDGERLLLGEWCFGRMSDLLGNIQTMGDTSPTATAFLRFAALLGPLWRADHAAYLKVIDEYTRLAGIPYWQAKPHMGQVMEAAIPRYCILSRMLLPSLDSVRTRQAAMQAQVRVARVGLALERHKRVHGAYPSRLADIDAAILNAAPEDPFTGKPLVYRAEGLEFVVYSVGENLKDDGGVPRPEAGKGSDEVAKQKAWDIPWRSGNAVR